MRSDPGLARMSCKLPGDGTQWAHLIGGALSHFNGVSSPVSRDHRAVSALALPGDVARIDALSLQPKAHYWLVARQLLPKREASASL